jgi:hypothetical protein
LGDVTRRRDEMSGRGYHVTGSPPAPVIRLGLARTDSNGSPSEHTGCRCPGGDLLQSHRELLYQMAALPPQWQRQGAHDYFLIFLSSHSTGALATTEPQEHPSAAAVAVRCDRDRLCRFRYRLAVREASRPPGSPHALVSTFDGSVRTCSARTSADCLALPTVAGIGRNWLSPSDLEGTRNWGRRPPRRGGPTPVRNLLAWRSGHR